MGNDVSAMENGVSATGNGGEKCKRE